MLRIQVSYGRGVQYPELVKVPKFGDCPASRQLGETLVVPCQCQIPRLSVAPKMLEFGEVLV